MAGRKEVGMSECRCDLLHPRAPGPTTAAILKASMFTGDHSKAASKAHLPHDLVASDR